MRYALLNHVDEGLWNGMGQEQQAAALAEYGAFGERYMDKIRGGDGLHGVATATTVRVREGRTLTTDGPFAETKEQLAGFYIVDCANLDEAVEIASHIPAAAHGSVEVRPVMEFDQA